MLLFLQHKTYIADYLNKLLKFFQALTFTSLCSHSKKKMYSQSNNMVFQRIKQVTDIELKHTYITTYLQTNWRQRQLLAIKWFQKLQCYDMHTLIHWMIQPSQRVLLLRNKNMIFFSYCWTFHEYLPTKLTLCVCNMYIHKPMFLN